MHSTGAICEGKFSKWRKGMTELPVLKQNQN